MGRQTDGSSDQWVIGPMGFRTNESSDQWVVGPMSLRTNESSDQWVVRPMGLLTNGSSDQWVFGPMGFRTNGPSDRRRCTNLIANATETLKAKTESQIHRLSPSDPNVHPPLDLTLPLLSGSRWVAGQWQVRSGQIGSSGQVD